MGLTRPVLDERCWVSLLFLSRRETVATRPYVILHHFGFTLLGLRWYLDNAKLAVTTIQRLAILRLRSVTLSATLR